jgi:hypothetical protein
VFVAHKMKGRSALRIPQRLRLQLLVSIAILAPWLIVPSGPLLALSHHTAELSANSSRELRESKSWDKTSTKQRDIPKSFLG